MSQGTTVQICGQIPLIPVNSGYYIINTSRWPCCLAVIELVSVESPKSFLNRPVKVEPCGLVAETSQKLKSIKFLTMALYD